MSHPEPRVFEDRANKQQGISRVKRLVISKAHGVLRSVYLLLALPSAFGLRRRGEAWEVEFSGSLL